MRNPEPKIRCPRCGNQEARTRVYCGNCGAPLHSVVNVVNDSTIPSEYEAPNAPLVASSEQRPFTGYGGPISHTPIPLSPAQPRSGQTQPTGLSDQVIQYQYGSTPPYLPPPPPGSNPPPDYRPTVPVLPPTGGNSRKSSKWRLWVIVGSIIVVVLGSIVAGAVGIISHSNYVTAQATATAHAQATGTAVAKATQTVAAMQTATAIANQNPYDNGSWHVEFSDPLITPRYWQEAKASNYGDCTFINSQYYRITVPKPGYYYPCEVQGTSTTYTDVTMEVTMDILTGDCGGFILRDSGTTNYVAYLVFICQNGAYEIDKTNNTSNSSTTALLTGSSATISGSLGKNQVVAVTAIGTFITLFVNKTRIFQHADSTYTQGAIGLVAWDEMRR